MTDIALVTLATGNHLPGAGVTCQSFLDHHPGARAAVVLIDGVRDLLPRLDPRVDVLTPQDLPIDHDELLELMVLYGPFELAMAMKPLAVLAMLDRHPGPVLYLDSDIEVLGPFDDVVELAERTGLALTPHRFSPVPDDGLLPDEETLFQGGVFNAGFVAAAAAGRPLLEAWARSLRRDCVVDPLRQRYVDQRWLDHVIGLGPVEVVRDPGCNVGYWNVDERPLHQDGASGFTAAGAALCFFHFSGFEPTKPWVLSRHVAGAPRLALSQAPELATLCSSYADRLIAAGWEEAQRLPYAFGALVDGTPIDARMRMVFRRALERSDSTGGARPPNPFREGQLSAFWSLLVEPHPDHPRVSRYQFEVWQERPDVAATIGTLQRGSADSFADWLLDHGDEELGIPARLLPERPLVRRFREQLSPAPERREGLVIAGLVAADVGVGQAARLAIEAARAAGIEPEVVPYDNTMSRQRPIEGTAGLAEARGDVALVCLNPDVLPNFVDSAWPRFALGRRVVGLWFWEVDVVTDAIRQAFDLVDEVWVTTDHVREALAPVATKPVELVDLPLVSAQVEVGEDPRGRLGIAQDRFTFLFTYDSFSVPERKNPLGVVEAFSMAFAPDEGPILVIKTINGAGLEATEHLHHLAALRPDVKVLDCYLSSEEMHTLSSVADCYVSLHRAEGWGLTIAEAMAIGTPVIATGHSGNMAFMDGENSFPVPFHLISVGPGHAPYPANAVWAQPDLTAAAASMREVWENPARAREVAIRAKSDIEGRHTAGAVARSFADAVDRARDRLHGRT